MTDTGRVECDSAVHMRRVVITSDFVISDFRATDAFSFKRNLCGSYQELEFLKAVRLYFPSLLAHPNIPLRNFIEVDRVKGFTTETQFRDFFTATVDVLLCTPDEDPIAGIELDTQLDASAATLANHHFKNQLFNVAGIPLIRIRPTASSHVRAEDFYSLLCNCTDDLASLRPKRMRPRRNHDSLVPADGLDHDAPMQSDSRSLGG
jgi:hypothetical protein